MKKNFLLVLTMMLLAALVGCGSKEGKEDENAVVIKVSEHGAVGDGKTDDSVAIDAALDMAKMKGRDGASVVLEFEKDKAYYFKEMNRESSIFDLEGYKNLTVCGDNTTLLLDKSMNLVHWFNVNESENIKIQGFNLKLAQPMYTLSKVDAVSLTDEPYLDITTERSLGITETFTAGYIESHGASYAFALPYTGDVNRMHIYVNSIEPLDATANKYRVHIRYYDDHETKIKYMMDNDLPFMVGIPGWGRYGDDDGSGAVVVTNTTNLEMQDINVWSSPTMVFHMRNNYGEIHMQNCNVTTEPGTDDVLASWVDIFHIKENRAKFIIEDSTFEKAQDDVFNFSTTNLLVDEVVSETEVKLVCKQLGGYWMPLEVGDTITFIHEKAGHFVGRTRIKEVKEQGEITHIVVEDALPMVGIGVAAYVDSLGQPGSVIRNCKISGTYRFRTEITIEDCELNTVYAWIDNYPTNEGPIPRNITFKGCKFNSIKADDPSVCYISSEYMMQIGAQTIPTSGIPAYYSADNIVFEDCDIDHTLINFMDNSANVTFIKDGKEYYSVKAKTRP